ncbi:MAG: FAD-dependent oxidoreductase [Saccharofermentanales bacterium]|jgi:fumarate reductase flavoprotein subunit
MRNKSSQLHSAQQFEISLAVIGAGPGGLAAALAAAQRNIRVTVFEKSNKTGGALNGGKGPFGVETIQQRRLQRVVTREEAFRYFMDYSHWQANPELVAAYVNKSPDTIRWLESLGCEFESLNAYVEGGNHTWHVYDDSEHGICDRILAEAKRLGVEVRLNCPAVGLIVEKGAVRGLIAEQDGEKIEVRAGAVVISTGGFGNNSEMVAKYTPYKLGETVWAMTSNCDGDGINMAWSAGGSRGFMFYDAFAGLAHPTLGGPGGFCSELRAFRQPNLLVNCYGRRFTDETAMCNGAYGINVVRQQPGTCAYILLTDKIVETYRHDGFAVALPSRDPYTNEYSDWPDGFEEKMQEVISKRLSQDLYMADSINELAAQMGVDESQLTATIEEYNNYCDAGEDPVFHKRRGYLKPIRGEHFYAARICANSYATLGGININSKAEVVNDEMLPIPGLYAAGNDANTICIDTYCFGMPGHTSGFAYNTGRLAGENAAEYIKTL